MKISKIDPQKIIVKESLLSKRIEEWDNSSNQSVIAVEDEVLTAPQNAQNEGVNSIERSRSDTNLHKNIENNNSIINVGSTILQAEEEHSSNKLVKSVLKSSSSKMVIRKIKSMFKVI